jgi:DNA-binding beta-propeller fold protein YncE
MIYSYQALASLCLWYSLTTSVVAAIQGSVTTVAGGPAPVGSTNGIGTIARFSYPGDVRISPDGLFALVADSSNNIIRQIIISTSSVTTFAGVAGSSGYSNGVGSSALFGTPQGLDISNDGIFAVVADSIGLIRYIVISTTVVSTVAGDTGVSGTTDGVGTNARFFYPHGLSISPSRLFMLVADRSNSLIRQIVISTAAVTTLAGGTGTNAIFSYPHGISISPDGLFALVADTNSYLVRHIVISTATVTKFVGTSYGSTNGIGTAARFFGPYGISISLDGLYALVADSDDNSVRLIVISTKNVSLLAGNGYASSGSSNGIGTNSRFYYPRGLGFSPDGTFAFLADQWNFLIRRIDLLFPTATPSQNPSIFPTSLPSVNPTAFPSNCPTCNPTTMPSVNPTVSPSNCPTCNPSLDPTFGPTTSPTLPLPNRYSFGVLFGDSSILARGNALLLDYFVSDRQGMLASLVTPLTRPFLLFSSPLILQRTSSLLCLLL